MKPIDRWNGEAFRNLRRRSGTTAADLAEQLGVTEDVVRRWEDGSELPSGHARERLDVWLSTNPMISDGPTSGGTEG